MSELIDAKGLGCAQPVILARDALDLCDEVTIVVDERTALENLKLLGCCRMFSRRYRGTWRDLLDTLEQKDLTGKD